MQIATDSAGVRFPPPFVFLGFLLLGWAIDRHLLPTPMPIAYGARVGLGVLVFAAGAAMVMAASRRFTRIGTARPPWRPTTGIVRDGVYAWTRNPMYVGMALLYAGIGLALDSWLVLALLPVVLVVIRLAVIAREERYLAAKFGDEYRGYQASVRRWL